MLVFQGRTLTPYKSPVHYKRYPVALHMRSATEGAEKEFDQFIVSFAERKGLRGHHKWRAAAVGKVLYYSFELQDVVRTAAMAIEYKCSVPYAYIRVRPYLNDMKYKGGHYIAYGLAHAHLRFPLWTNLSCLEPWLNRLSNESKIVVGYGIYPKVFSAISQELGHHPELCVEEERRLYRHLHDVQAAHPDLPVPNTWKL